MSWHRFTVRIGASVALGLAIGFVATATAADPVAPGDAKAFDKLVVDTLRDVHNKGADLYNERRDYDGAYRFYQGALLTIKPLLAHRPTTQKAIEDGLAAAEKDPDITRKGFLLHETIEKVRSELRGDAKKPDDKGGKGTEPQPPGKVDITKVTGKVSYLGKRVAEGEIAFVPADPKAKTMTATIKDGSYTIILTPGKYTVAVTGGKDIKLPAKYSASDTSGLMYEAKAGSNAYDIELK